MGDEVRVVYVSYDGALDPLGASQILPYLVRLARRGVSFTLISFEKAERWSDDSARHALQDTLDAAAIRWRPLRYHKRPRVPATLWDFLAGLAAIRKEIREPGPLIVHGRGDVATTMARLADMGGRAKLLYDIRAFFADDRVEQGSWRRGGAIDRAVRRAEALNLGRADGIVVLTRAAIDPLREGRPLLPPYQVIPTCVDLDAFSPTPPTAARVYGAICAGSFGPRYLPRETVLLGRTLCTELGGRALFLTPNVEEVLRAGVTTEWADVEEAQPGEVPGWLRRARAVFFLCRPGRHNLATFPTRLGEALAAGLPVVTNEGIGDLDSFIEAEGVGVLVRGFGPASFSEAAQRLKVLLADRETSGRCRRLAESRLGVELGVNRYLDLYRRLAS